MTDYTPHTPGGFTLRKMIAIGVVLTLALILGIKYFISSGPESAEEGSRAAGSSSDIFKTESQPNNNQGYNPARRRESLGGGGSLEMFKKTNAGYTKEDEAKAPARETQKPAAQAAAAQPAVKPAAAAGTAIPKLKPVPGFGAPSAGAGKTGLPNGAAGTPDLSSIIKSVTKNMPKKPQKAR